MKKTLTENKLRNIISTQVAQVLKESDWNDTYGKWEDWQGLASNNAEGPMADPDDDWSNDEPNLRDAEMGAAHDEEERNKVVEMLKPVAEQLDKLQEQFQDTINAFGGEFEELTEIGDQFMGLNDALQEFVGTDEEAPETSDDMTNMNENKKSKNMKKTINEAALRKIVAAQVAKVLRESMFEDEDYPEDNELSSNNGPDREAILRGIKDFALKDRMVVKDVKEEIKNGERDNNILQWIDRTLTKHNERGDGTPLNTTEDAIDYMIYGDTSVENQDRKGRGHSYLKSFASKARRDQQIKSGRNSKDSISNHHTNGANSTNTEEQMRYQKKLERLNNTPAGIPNLEEAIARNVRKALRNLK